MPELPEVEVIRKELIPLLTGQILGTPRIFWPKSFINDATESISGKSVSDIGRQGKYLVIILSSGYLVVHLRMTGQLMVVNEKPSEKKHLQVVIPMKSGKYLVYFDSRKFGRIIHVDDLKTVLKNTGVDALSPEFTPELFRMMLKKKNRMIKSFLMDQSQIAGLGNIYVDESLFRSGIHPKMISSRISAKKVDKLFNAIRDTLRNSIGKMGTTISDYKTTGGGFGGYQNYLQVYGKAGKPCPVCGTVIRKIRMNNRGTHFCPACQKLRRVKR